VGFSKKNKEENKMEFKKYHRRYPDTKWDYKAISTKIDGREIIFYTLNNKGRRSQGVEMFQGSNYDPDSSARSYSRRYSVSGVPSKYKKIVSTLRRKHRDTKWSKEKRVDYN
jgi:hypothetical protein